MIQVEQLPPCCVGHRFLQRETSVLAEIAKACGIEFHSSEVDPQIPRIEKNFLNPSIHTADHLYQCARLTMTGSYDQLRVASQMLCQKVEESVTNVGLHIGTGLDPEQPNSIRLLLNRDEIHFMENL